MATETTEVLADGLDRSPSERATDFASLLQRRDYTDDVSILADPDAAVVTAWVARPAAAAARELAFEAGFESHVTYELDGDEAFLSFTLGVGN